MYQYAYISYLTILADVLFLDEDEFKNALKSALGSDSIFDEKFEMFGKPFMDLCLKAAAQPSVKTPKISELHAQYDYKGSPSKRTGGFKPAPSRTASRKLN